MSSQRFIETIKVKDGVFYNLPLHNYRANRTSIEHFGKPLDLNLTDSIIPEDMRQGIVKCRILYSSIIESITFEAYLLRAIRSLSLVYDNDIDYSYKSANRDRLQHLVSQKGNCDEILIVKDGYITDTSYTNVVLENNEGFFTPSTPLLKGIRRQSLINNGVIQEREITPDSLADYSRIHLINAMIGLEDSISLSTQNIITG